MANLKRQMFQKALGIHTSLKSIPYYTRGYNGLKDVLFNARNASGVRDATTFCTHYEDSALVPDLIVYEAFHASSMACGPAAIYEAAQADPRFANHRHVWVIDDPDAVPPGLAARKNTTVVARHDRDYPRLLATAGTLVNNSTFPYWYTRREGQVYVNTWHGTPLKTMFRDENAAQARFANSQRNFLQASHIIMSSDYATRYLLGSAGIAPLVATKTYQIGTPRLDRTLRARASWTRTDGARHILFAPTWKGVIGQAESQIGEINAMIKALRDLPGDPITLHVKAHNFNTDDLGDMTRHSADGLTVKAVPGTRDINDVMAEMDVVITDYSSLMIDALAADIPVLLFVPDLLIYGATRGLYLDLETLPLTLCHDAGQLRAALDDPKPPHAFEQADVARATYYPDDDGQAAARALDVMLGADGAPAPLAQTSKPVIAMMAGAWKRNGITSSAMNLLSNIDTDTYDVVVLTDGPRLEDGAWPQINSCPPEIMFVHRMGHEGFTRKETRAKSIFYADNTFDTTENETLMQQAMRREARRMIGGMALHTAIEFSGYRRLWCWIIAMSNAAQTIVYQHNDIHAEMKARFPNLAGVMATYPYYDKIVAVSEETRALNFKKLNSYYPETKSTALRNSLNVSAIHAAATMGPDHITIDGIDCTPLSVDPAESDDVISLRTMPPIDPSATNFITMGRFSGEKNHAMLLRAFARLIKTQPKTHLYILGEGPLLDQTRALRDAMGLQGHVTLPGFSSRALQLMRQCDCFVLPSVYEGQPMVILEALTLNKPVIVTDIAGSRSALAGGYGHIVEGKISDASFATAMEAFCKGMLSFKSFDADAYNKDVVADFHALIAGPSS